MKSAMLALQCALLACLSGCSSPMAAADVPALLESDVAARAELQSVVSAALQRNQVLLADDALTQQSELIIEPTGLKDAQGARVQGRETRLPERFSLVKAGARCVLIHENSGRRFDLERARCRPAK